MKKILGTLGLAMVLSALLVVSITGAVFATGPSDNATQTQTQNQGDECICGECPCEECPVGDCNKNQTGNCYKYGYANAGAPEDGGYKHAHQNGKTVE